ncbi:MAG: ATP-binding protein [Candidatus Dormibacteraceae bacterium]
MSLSELRIKNFNPWWIDPINWKNQDPNLQALMQHAIRLPSPWLKQIPPQPGIHILRGPRQVGKTTDLKLLIQHYLDSGWPSRSPIYLACDLLGGRHFSELYETVELAKQLSRYSGQQLLLLDEVTVIEGWDEAVKALWDYGLIRADLVVCTGSSTIDLRQKAAERWPGRRGKGRDHLLLPQTFASFAQAMTPTVPPSPGLTVSQLLEPEGRDLLHDIRLHLPNLQEGFRLYLKFGGLPSAVAEAKSGLIEPSSETVQIFSDSLIKEIQRKGVSETAMQALLERIAHSLSSKISWTTIAQELDIPLGNRSKPFPSHHTVRNYVEFLAAGYFALILYFWRSGSGGNDLSRDKKIYFGDPLLLRVAAEYCPALAVEEAALVENALALALFRRYEAERNQLTGFANPTQLHVWGTHSGSEVDFVAGPRNSLELIECKYREKINKNTLMAMQRTLPNRPMIIATKNHFELGENWALLPAPLLAWALG